MVPERELDELDTGVLCIVFIQVCQEMLVIAGVDGGGNAFGPFVKHGEHTVVNKVVNQNDTAFGASYKVGNVCPSHTQPVGKICSGSILGAA